MSDEWMIKPKIKELINVGECLYEELSTSRLPDADFIVCPSHLGDTVWMASLAGAYKEQYRCPKLFYVIKEPQKEIIGYFPDIDGTLHFDASEMLALQLYMMSRKYWKRDHIIYAMPNMADVICQGANVRFKYYCPDFCKTMIEQEKNILDLTGEVVPSRMRPLDDGNNKEFQKCFGKSVLLLPVAQSLEMIPVTFWERLAIAFKEQGFDVYTNYNGFKYEVMVEGTLPLSTSIVELATVAPYFACVISHRSGACDLLAHTDTNLFILYNKLVDERKIYLKCDELGTSNIFDMVDRERIHNYQYIQELEDCLINELVSHLQ